MKRLMIGAVISTLLISCKSNLAKSDLSLTNGTVIGDKTHPEVVWLNGCTGTAVSHNTVITAAHCTNNGAPRPVYDYDAFSKTGKTSIIANPLKGLAHPGRRTTIGSDDLAVMVFPSNTFRYWVAIETNPLAINPFDKEVVLVGYAYVGGYKKRIDTNKSAEVRGGLVNIYARGGSVAQQGDSGGPMLKNEKLVGVASGSDNSYTAFSFYAQLASPSNLAFLRSTVEKIGAVITGLDGQDNSRINIALAASKRGGEYVQLRVSSMLADDVTVCRGSYTEICGGDAQIEMSSATGRGYRLFTKSNEEFAFNNQEITIFAKDRSGKIYRRNYLITKTGSGT